MYTRPSLPGSGCTRIKSTPRQRCGSVGMMLIMVMVIALVLLPLSVTLIRQLHSRLMICQAEQLIEEIMNSSLLLADTGAMGDGQFKFSIIQLQQHIQAQLDEQMPAALARYFRFDRIEMDLQDLRSDEVLWHAGRDELSWPVVTCYASVTDYQGRVLPIRRSVICRFGRAIRDLDAVDP